VTLFGLGLEFVGVMLPKKKPRTGYPSNGGWNTHEDSWQHGHKDKKPKPNPITESPETPPLDWLEDDDNPGQLEPKPPGTGYPIWGADPFEEGALNPQPDETNAPWTIDVTFDPHHEPPGKLIKFAFVQNGDS